MTGTKKKLSSNTNAIVAKNGDQPQKKTCQT